MPDAIFELDAEVRTDIGKGASRRLRRADKVPAVLYGADKQAVALTLDHNKVIQAQEFEAFYSHVLTLNIDGEAVATLIKDMQRHPYKPKILHMDFLRVDATQTVTTQVPLHFVNQDTCVGIKVQGGHAEQHLSSVEVACLPAQLPEFIEVDLATTEKDQTVHLSDLILPEGVKLVELAKGSDHDQAVVTIKGSKGGSDDAADDTAE